MNSWLRVLAVGVTMIVLGTGTSLAQSKPGCNQAGAPEKVEGTVMNIDLQQGKVTVRERNGTIHAFQGSPETLRDLKVGDTIEAKLRPLPNC